jgi:hypothetical protein
MRFFDIKPSHGGFGNFLVSFLLLHVCMIPLAVHHVQSPSTIRRLNSSQMTRYPAVIRELIDRDGYYMPPGSAPTTQVGALLEEISSKPARRTPLNKEDISVWWDEIDLHPSSSVVGLVLDPALRKQIEKEYGRIRQTFVWANRYIVGEHIPKHCDAAGDLQLVFAVETPAAENGGVLRVYRNDKPVSVVLQRGQRLLFVAASTFHETTPLVSTSTCQYPRRIVCVCRLFF